MPGDMRKITVNSLNVTTHNLWTKINGTLLLYKGVHMPGKLIYEFWHFIDCFGLEKGRKIGILFMRIDILLFDNRIILHIC